MQPAFSQTYTFYTRTDDGVRLWVDHKLLIDDWTNHAPSERGATVTLQAGVRYDLQMEYFDNTGGAVSQLRWSSPSVAKQIVPQSALTPTISELTFADIGSPTPTGSSAIVTPGQSYNVTAGGRDVYGNSDEFRFGYRRVTGDFDTRVRVASLSATDAWTKAGLMARESLASNSRNVFAFTTPTTFRMTTRSATGASTTGNGSVATSIPNAWLRLRRVGSTFQSYYSTNGNTWTLLAQSTVTMSADVYIGIALTSHKPGFAATGQFRDLA